MPASQSGPGGAACLSGRQGRNRPGGVEADTILVVDDQKRLRKGLARSLGQEDFRTLTAASGDEAFRLIERTRVDVVITDLVMPGMDGMALVRKIRESALDVDVIIITAYGSAESVREAEELGVAHYLAKPFDLPELKSKVKELLARRADGGNQKARGRTAGAHGLPADVGRPAPSRARAERGAGCPAEGSALQGGAGALKGLPGRALERVRPGNLVRASGRALKAAANASLRAVSCVSPRNVARGLGKAARTISGLASTFLR